MKHGKLFQLATLLTYKRDVLWFGLHPSLVLKNCCTQARLYASGQGESSKTEGPCNNVDLPAVLPQQGLNISFYHSTCTAIASQKKQGWVWLFFLRSPGHGLA